MAVEQFAEGVAVTGDMGGQQLASLRSCWMYPPMPTAGQ